jgi:hypothetical protein
MEVSIALASGKSVVFDVDEGVGVPTFLLSVRKCGSSLINKICKALALADRRCFVDVGRAFFSNNLTVRDWQRDPALSVIIRSGAIYGGFRAAPIGLFEDARFRTAPKLIMIRDPRDALVSQYFSTAYSHTVPEPTDGRDAMTRHMREARSVALGTTVGDYVVKMAQSMARTIEAYRPVLSMPNVVTVKYEDVVLQKRVLIDLLVRHFALSVGETKITNILRRMDVVPAEENPRAFVRQVLPGDHKRKLDDKTIEELNVVLAEAMQIFEYKP